MRKAITPFFLISLLLLAPAFAQAVGESEVRSQIQIAAQRLETALQDLAQQRGLQIICRTETVGDIHTAGVSGELTRDEALKKLLEGTNLTYHYIDSKTVSIQPISSSTITSQAEGNPLRLAQAQTPSPETAQSQKSQDSKTQEIVVTGSHIRGPQNLASPLIVLGREEIQRSGAQTVAQLMRSLPQNFGGGQNAVNSESATGNSAANGGNVGKSTSMNLRGLGSEATLVLVNGRRLAPSGAQDAVDISSIPLSAVEQVDVLLDGASAAYGADAVGGVVNFILKKDYEGADTILSFGSSPSGGTQRIAAQSLGTRWSSGNALLSYEYSKQDAIFSTERSYSNTINPSMTLIPDAERNSVLVALDQTLAQRYSLFLQALGTRRTFTSILTTPGISTATNRSSMKQHSVSTGINAQWSEAWQSMLSLSSAKDTLDYSSVGIIIPTGAAAPSAQIYTSRVDELELQTSGALFKIPGGDVKMAVGAGALRQYSDIVRNQSIPRREVKNAYLETNFPIVGDGNSRFLLRRLNLSLEGRYEDYSDFGNAFSPKVGVLYSPIETLTLRGTWGRAFRAPKPFNLFALRQVTLQNVPAGAAPGAPFAEAVRTGGNENLGPEKSKSYTAGFDFQPAELKNLRFSATYFDIRYDDRILVPSGSAFTAPSTPAYAPLIQANPSPIDVQTLIQSADLLTNRLGATPLSAIQYIVDFRFNNVAGLHTNGLDMQFDVKQDAGPVNIDWVLNATKRFKYEVRTLPTTPAISQLDVIYQTPSLRARAGSGVGIGSWKAWVFANYVHGYLNNSVTPNADVSSWTTFDAQIAYVLAQGKTSWLSDARIALSASNVFNRDPPFAAQFVPIGFDTTNADPLGRFMNLAVEIHW